MLVYRIFVCLSERARPVAAGYKLATVSTCCAFRLVYYGNLGVTYSCVLSMSTTRNRIVLEPGAPGPLVPVQGVLVQVRWPMLAPALAWRARSLAPTPLAPGSI